jgi:hypothetical protein
MNAILLNCWNFSLRHPGLLLVLVGVAGEVYFEWKEEAWCKHWKKKVSALLLIFGLCLEFIEAAKSDKNVAASIENASNAEKEAKEANLLAAKVGTTNAQLSFKIEELRSNNFAFSLVTEGLRSNNLEVDKRLTEEANEAHKAEGGANVRAALIESNNSVLSFTVEGLHSNNLALEKTVEQLRQDNLQIETKMINGLYSHSYIEQISLEDTRRVKIRHTGQDTFFYIILPKAPIPMSVNATIIYHHGFIRSFAGLLLGSDYNKFYPIYLTCNKNIVSANLGTPLWDQLEYPRHTRIDIRYTELQQQTNLWKNVELKGKEVYFDDIKQEIK